MDGYYTINGEIDMSFLRRVFTVAFPQWLFTQYIMQFTTIELLLPTSP